MSVYQTNAPIELVPVAGVSDVSLTATGSSQLLTSGVTIASGTQIVEVQPQGGDIRFTVDGSSPTTSVGTLWLNAGILQMHVGNAAVFRFCGSGTDTPVVRVSQRQYATSSVRRAADLSVALESKKFIDVVKWVISFWNSSPTAWLADVNTGADDKARVVYAINDALRRIWTHAAWTQLTVTEEREVDNTGDYPFIPWAETGYINIGTVFGVWSADPRDRASDAYPLDYSQDSDGLVVPAEITDTAFVRHRIRPHEFTLVEYAGGTTYAAGDLAYYATTGECYRRLSAGSGVSPVDTSTWEVMRIPADFARFVQAQALADFLVSRQPKDSARWQSQADEEFYIAGQRLPQIREFQTAHVRVAS